ncbi:MAG TPA: hypothetical protein VEW74_01825 [Candidatus Nitrosotalea sp.]|nr:hypothetical protein [Candidatus Nitrosotalea sp.]
MWSIVGLVLALAVGAAAWGRSRTPGGFFDREVYAMNAAAHRRYAFVSLAFALYFTVAYARGFDAAGIAGLALYAVVAVFYAASFLQGASDE